VIIEAKVAGKWVAFDPLAFGSSDTTAPHHVRSPKGELLSAFDLVLHPELAPAGVTFGPDFFRQGSRLKIEASSEYGRFSVTPRFIYGRDWPTLDRERPEEARWLYDDAVSGGLRAVVPSMIFPYCFRLTAWFGRTPLLFHYEAVPLALIGAGVLLARSRRFAPRRLAGFALLAGVAAAYTIAAVMIWVSRYTA
jgi:hypothetical protein